MASERRCCWSSSAAAFLLAALVRRARVLGTGDIALLTDPCRLWPPILSTCSLRARNEFKSSNTRFKAAGVSQETLLVAEMQGERTIADCVANLRPLLDRMFLTEAAALHSPAVSTATTESPSSDGSAEPRSFSDCVANLQPLLDKLFVEVPTVVNNNAAAEATSTLAPSDILPGGRRKKPARNKSSNKQSQVTMRIASCDRCCVHSPFGPKI